MACPQNLALLSPCPRRDNPRARTLSVLCRRVYSAGLRLVQLICLWLLQPSNIPYRSPHSRPKFTANVGPVSHRTPDRCRCPRLSSAHKATIRQPHSVKPTPQGSQLYWQSVVLSPRRLTYLRLAHQLAPATTQRHLHANAIETIAHASLPIRYLLLQGRLTWTSCFPLQLNASGMLVDTSDIPRSLSSGMDVLDGAHNFCRSCSCIESVLGCSSGPASY